MKRIVTGIALVLVMLAAFALREWNTLSFAVFIAVLNAISVYEMHKAFKDKFNKGFSMLCGALAFLTLPAYLQFGLNGILLFIVLLFLIALVIMVIDKHVTLDSVQSFGFISIYPTLFLSLLFELNTRQHGLLLIILPFAIGPVADTAAYFVGSLLKGKKLCPSVSPNKTISGAIGGLIGGVISCVLIYLIFNVVYDFGVQSPALYIMVIVGFFGAVFTIFGDLAESAIKRRLNIKDFSNFLPGHGGLLDRIDSIMFNTVFIYLFFTYIYHLV